MSNYHNISQQDQQEVSMNNLDNNIIKLQPVVIANSHHQQEQKKCRC